MDHNVGRKDSRFDKRGRGKKEVLPDFWKGKRRKRKRKMPRQTLSCRGGKYLSIDKEREILYWGRRRILLTAKKRGKQFFL